MHSPGLVRIWNPLNGACLKTLIDDDNPPVSSVRVRARSRLCAWACLSPCARRPQFSPNSRYLLLGTLNNTLRLWDYARDTCVRTFKGHESTRFCAFSAFGRHDGTVICGGEDRALHLWDLQTGMHLQALPGRESSTHPGDGHCDVVVALDVHPTRRICATGALEADRTIKLWTAEEAQQMQEG